MKLTDLTSLRQRNDESVASFVQRFREVINKCFNLALNDSQLIELAFQRLLPHIREKYGSQEFDSLSQLANRLSGQEGYSYDQRRNYQKRVAFSGDSSSDSEGEVDIAEWV